MSKVRFLLVGAGATLALGTAGVLASVGAVTLTSSDSHGDAVASAARETCPHGPNGVHGKCVSAVASSNSESKAESEAPDTTCNANDATEDASETKASAAEDTSEKSANTTKAADKQEGKSEKSAAKAEDKSERAACEAPKAPEAPEAAD
jgi:hypothetical protein